MQTTSATWKALYAAGAPLEARAVIGGTNYTDISAPVISRAAMQDRLSIGNVVSAALQLSVRTGAAIARSASVAVEVRLNDGETASEWLPAGTFYIARRARDPVTGVLALECYDALLKANAVWEPSSGAWPRTMGSVVTEFLTLLGVSLDSRTVIPSGAAFVVSEPAEGTTIRDVLGMIGQAGGGNWIITPENKLRLVPLVSAAGAAEAEDDVADVAGVVGALDVSGSGTITGIRDTWKGDVSLTGTDSGIVVDVSLPPVMVAQMADALLGQSHQAYSLEGAIYDPAAELGDYVRGGANGEIASALYSERVTLGPAFRGDIGAPEAGELSDEYPYIGANARTLALARADIQEAVDELDGELDQQEIFNRLTDDGAAQGLVLYNGQLYINASYINAGTLSANRISGGTLTVGGQNNQSGVIQVLDGNGNVVGTIDRQGISFPGNGAIEAINFRLLNPSDGTRCAAIIPVLQGGLAVTDGSNNYLIQIGTTGVQVYGNQNVSGGIWVDGTGSFGSLGVTGAAQINDTLNVGGDATFGEGLNVLGDAVFLGTVLGNLATGVKGDRESSYRTGNVNLTLANVGAPQTAHYNPTNLDTLKSTGLYSAWSVSGTGTSAFDSLYGEVINISENPWGTGTRVNQIFLSFFSNEIWQRKLTDNTWSSWKQLMNKNGAVPISAGGTGQTEVSTPFSGIGNIVASTESGWSITAASCKQWGKVAMVSLTIKRTGTAVSSGDKAICTLRSDLKPALDAPLVAPNADVNSGSVRTSGGVHIVVSSTWAQNAEKNAYAIYILA